MSSVASNTSVIPVISDTFKISIKKNDSWTDHSDDEDNSSSSPSEQQQLISKTEDLFSDDDDYDREIEKLKKALQEIEKKREERKKEKEEKKKKIAQEILNRISSAEEKKEQTEKLLKELIEQIKKDKERLQELGIETSSSSSSWAGKAKVGGSNGNSVPETKSPTKYKTKSDEPTEWKIYGFDHKVLTEFTLSKESFDFHLKEKKTSNPNATVICTFMCKGQCTRSECGFLHPSHCQNKCNDSKCPFFHEHREDRTAWIQSYNEFFQNKFYNLFE